MTRCSFTEIIERNLNRQISEDFEINGFCVLDSPFPPEVVEEMVAQVKHCFYDIPGAKIPNAVQFLTTDGALQLTKPHIFECDLHQKHIRDQLPFFKNLFDKDLGELVEVLRERFSSLEDLVPFTDAEEASTAITLKLQMNEGGSFPWHYDNPSRPNKRRLTMAVYLTENWCEAVGGELQVMPFLEAPTTIPPRANTVVLFRSDTVLHRTLPLHAEGGQTRLCFTVWFDGLMTNSDEDLYLRASHLREDAILSLKRSPLQRTLSRALYEEEFRDGIVDCFGKDSKACTLGLAEHEVRVKQLLSNESVAKFVTLLKTYKSTVDDA